VVINSDICTDIDIGAAYRYHLTHKHLVTMVMHDYEAFNTVLVDKNANIKHFSRTCSAEAGLSDMQPLAFTGIHIIDPEAFAYISGTGEYADIIDAYDQMIADGRCPKAHIVEPDIWHDIGTPQAYKEIAFDEMARRALCIAFSSSGPYITQSIAPDGSDNHWYRIISEQGTIVACDRGIKKTAAITETESFAHIGNHLFSTTGAVPEIFLTDSFAGLCFMEDLGSTNLQTIIKKSGHPKIIEILYKQVIDRLVKLATTGYEGFQSNWTYLTASYDKELIIKQECHYFTRSFLVDYLGMADMQATLETEFDTIADMTLAFAIDGLMHRDMQSRNIMIKDNHPYFIDFQGARTGPIQYDLAALLIDPYTALKQSMQDDLADYYKQKLAGKMNFDERRFNTGYACCCVTRNLQMLGAFGYLTVKKNKSQFKAYIPLAVSGLLKRINHLENITQNKFPRLTKVVETALDTLAKQK